MSRLSSRPYDPTASSVLNLIIGETHALLTGDDYIFIPSHGPFYSNTLVVRSQGQLLKLGKDYELKGLHIDAAMATGKSVACLIRVLNRKLTEVSFDYQVVGGKFAEVYSVLKYVVENMGAGEIDRIPWDNIGDKPDRFNSAAHRHPYWEIEGWRAFHTPMNKVLQGVYHRKMKRIREAYDYYYSKETGFVENRDAKIKFVLDTIEQAQLTNVDPLRIIKIVAGTNAPNVETQGVWQSVVTSGNDRVLGGAGSSANLGKTVNLSADIVYPQPDNIILDEAENPILRDDDEWIYQDNQYPVVPLAAGLIDEDGIEFTAKEWDLFYYKAYSKVSHAGVLFANITANKTVISDGEVVTFTLATSRYPVGLRVPYQLVGVGASNVNIPLTGYVTIGANGTVSLAVTLIARSTATYNDKLTLELAIAGGIEHTVKYNLSTNDTKKIVAGFTENVNDLEKSFALPSELFFVNINRIGFMPADTTNVQLTFTFDDGVKHPIVLDYSTNVVPGTPVTVNLDNPVDWWSLMIKPTTVFNSRRLNLNVSYKGRVLATTSIELRDVSARVYAISMLTGSPITEVKDDEPFRWVAETNTTGVLVPQLSENTVGQELTPAIGNAVSVANGKAQTPLMTVSRQNRKRTDYMTVRFTTTTGKVLGSYRLTVPVNV